MAHRPDYELELAYAMAGDESYRRATLAVREEVQRRCSFFKPMNEERQDQDEAQKTEG